MGTIYEDPRSLAEPTQCQKCKYYLGFLDKVEDICCKAFPWGIPEKYLFDDEPHSTKDEEQEGDFVFELSATWKKLI